MHDFNAFSWPDHLENQRIPDHAFGQAYASLNAVARSWIKKNIAQLYALYPPRSARHSLCSTLWTIGLQTSIRHQPREWVILLLPETQASPARSLAALLPAMTSGVRNILVIQRQQTDWSGPLLSALELCGVELVCSLGPRKIKKLLQSVIQENSHGVILAMDGYASHYLYSETDFDLSSTCLWREPHAQELRIWSDRPDQWDWDVLQWNHPGVRFDVWGPFQKNIPDAFRAMPGSWESFCRPGPYALAVPNHLAGESGMLQACLVLTPGQEGCWYWPDLAPEIFFRRAVTLATSPGAVSG
jgi:hypothetical protein